MTVKHAEVLSRILSTYPALRFEHTCDTVKFGDTEGECTGIVTSCALTIDVIRRAAERNANLIIVHEPCFYTHDDTTDWLEENRGFQQKTALLREHGMVVWRNHDHMHASKPDEIFLGVIAQLGWKEYRKTVNAPVRLYFELPETSVGELAAHLKERLHLTSGRLVGNPDARISRVAFCGHIFPSWNEKEQEATKLLSRDDVDALIAFESIEWTALGYARDAAQLGMNKAIIQPGHMVSEEPGMVYLAQKLNRLFEGQLETTFIASGDPWLSFA